MSKLSAASPAPTASRSMLSNEPCPEIAVPAAGVSETNNRPFSVVDLVSVGRDFASAKSLPSVTVLILTTFGSKRSITTARPSGASELNSTESWRFSPTVISFLSGLSRNSITAGVGSEGFADVSVAALFGARSSTGGVKLGVSLALADVVDTFASPFTTFLIAVATSIGLTLFASDDGANDAAFGCNAAVSVCGGFADELDVVDDELAATFVVGVVLLESGAAVCAVSVPPVFVASLGAAAGS